MTTKPLGINHLLPKINYYYEYVENFYYFVNNLIGSINLSIKNYNNLNELNNWNYSISPDLPNGLSLNTKTGEIYGSATVASKKKKYVITASNYKQTLKTQITITIVSQAISLTSFYYSETGQSTTEINSNIYYQPYIRGSQPIIYSISPNLPSSLRLNTSSGIISGTTPLTNSDTTYMITATNSKNSVSTDLRIIILDKQPSVFSYNKGTNSDNPIVNTAVSYVPSENSGTNIVYSVSPSPMIGTLQINSSTGVISGTLPSNPISISYQITASNTGGTKVTQFNLNVRDVPIQSISYNSGNQGISIISSSIYYPVTIVGGISRNYSISPNLPSTINLDSSSGLISGLTSNTSNSVDYVITATNSYGSVNTKFTLRNTYVNSTITTGSQYYNSTGLDLYETTGGNWRSVRYYFVGSSSVNFKIRTTSYLSSVGSINNNSNNYLTLITLQNYDYYDPFLNKYIGSGLLFALSGNQTNLPWTKLTIGLNVLYKSDANKYQYNSNYILSNNLFFNFSGDATYWEWTSTIGLYKNILKYGSSETKQIILE